MTPVEAWNVATRIIQAIISWPLSIGLIAIYFFWRFKEPISKLIKALELTLPSGHKIRSQLINTQTQNITDKEPERIEEFIRDNPEKIKVELETYFNGFWFERIYNLIYGSQISLLLYLDKMAPDSYPIRDIDVFYKEYVRRVAEINMTPNSSKEQYFGFLKSMVLVTSDGAGEDEKLAISKFGRDFLIYILREYRHLYTSKPF